MANIRATWVLPTIRVPSGLPLPISEIQKSVVEASADSGVTWTLLGALQPTDPQEAVLQNASAGDWMWRVTIFDTNDKESGPLEGTINVPDESAPGPATDLVLTLE